MGVGMGVNLLLLVAMVATNILSLYHLASLQNPSSPSPPAPVPDHLIRQLSTIRATINHLTRLRSSSSSSSASSPPPPELLLYARLSPIGSACRDNPTLLHRYMNYTPFSLCPSDQPLVESLILRGCHPLPRRRCFQPTPTKPASSLPHSQFPSSLSDSAVLWPPSSCNSFSCLARNVAGFDMKIESSKFISPPKSPLDLTVSQLLEYSRNLNSALRLAVDVGGETGTFAARMKQHNLTVLTTTMNLGAPYSETAALRGVVPLHLPLQLRLPIFDGVLDLVRCGHGVNRWIPTTALEFLLYDLDRVLRGGGFLWLDHFSCKAGDLEKVYGPLIGRLGYKRLRWATGNKTDSKNADVYLTALLQKPWK
ncbi:putative methyltransferase At1g29790 [Asimina triloba]